jgi:hypothetical protein
VVYQIVSYVSAAFALLAAGSWLMSALVKIPSDFDIPVFITHVDPLGGMGRGSSKELGDLGEALRRQSWWSKVAAINAAMASVLQATSVYLQPST